MQETGEAILILQGRNQRRNYMGKGNTAVGQWIRNKGRFADFFNAILFRGKQIVNPKELEVRDSKNFVAVEDVEGKVQVTERFRDVVMCWKQEVNLAILACENQENIHYAMPVRNMLYDAMTYTEQMKVLWETRKSEEKKQLTAEEYLSRFSKEDKLLPVITLVWYYGSDEWDGHLDLHGMLYDLNLYPKWKDFVPNYRINLVHANSIEDIKLFRTDLQQIFGMLQCKNSREKLQNYMNEEKTYFQNVDKETYFAIQQLLHSERVFKKLVKKETVGGIDMCKALEELYQEGQESGKELEQCSVIRKLSQTMDAERIAEIMKYDKEFVKRVINVTREHPKYSDEEVLKVIRDIVTSDSF